MPRSYQQASQLAAGSPRLVEFEVAIVHARRTRIADAAVTSGRRPKLGDLMRSDSPLFNVELCRRTPAHKGWPWGTATTRWSVLKMQQSNAGLIGRHHRPAMMPRSVEVQHVPRTPSRLRRSCRSIATPTKRRGSWRDQRICSGGIGEDDMPALLPYSGGIPCSSGIPPCMISRACCSRRSVFAAIPSTPWQWLAIQAAAVES